MNWFQKYRLEWIAEALRVYGFINRSHIQTKFGMSEPQAALDLRAFRKSNPGLLQYDASAKHYKLNR